MKKVLFVGDLTGARNYGAIATSESLMDLLLEKTDKEHFKRIDYRSFYAETPVCGWPAEKDINGSASNFKNKIKALLNRLGLLEKVRHMLGKGDDLGECHVPVRLSDFKDFSKEVLEGARLPYEKALIEWADAVIINAEGNIVNGTDKNGVYRFGGLYVLFVAYFSKVVMGKPCYIINHTVDPANRDVQEMVQTIYPLMDAVYVREKLSYGLLESWGITNHEYVPDALFSHDFERPGTEEAFKEKWKAKIDFSKPYICLGDSSGIKNRYNTVKWDVVKTYGRLIDKLKKTVCGQIVFIDGYNGMNYDIQQVIDDNSLVQVDLRNCGYGELYYMMKNAELFISGRWHTSIISLKAHTPILLFGSDSHKTEALYHEIDWPFYFFDTKSVPVNISRICEVARQILSYDCGEVWEKVEELSLLARRNADVLD